MIYYKFGKCTDGWSSLEIGENVCLRMKYYLKDIFSQCLWVNIWIFSQSYNNVTHSSVPVYFLLIWKHPHCSKIIWTKNLKFLLNKKLPVKNNMEINHTFYYSWFFVWLAIFSYSGVIKYYLFVNVRLLLFISILICQYYTSTQFLWFMNDETNSTTMSFRGNRDFI